MSNAGPDLRGVAMGALLRSSRRALPVSCSRYIECVVELVMARLEQLLLCALNNWYAVILNDGSSGLLLECIIKQTCSLGIKAVLNEQFWLKSAP